MRKAAQMTPLMPAVSVTMIPTPVICM